MKAQVVHKPGNLQDLTFQEVDSPQLKDGQVLIGVETIGLNFPDLLIIEGKYQYRPDPPFIPGGEVAGHVLAVGEGVDHVKEGDRVMAFDLHGAMAEQFTAPASNIFLLPDQVPMKVGAGIAMTYGTGYHALDNRAHLAPGETLLITGATGGTGSAAIQLGQAMGARVIAAVGSPIKVEIARSLGADQVVDYSNQSLKDQVKELTDGKGADVIFEVVGGDIFMECLRCINWQGRVLVVGFTSGTIPAAPTNLVLLKGSSIVGVFWGSFLARSPEKNRKNIAKVLGWTADGTIKPHVSATFPLEEAKTALAAFANRTAAGKIVLTVS